MEIVIVYSSKMRTYLHQYTNPEQCLTLWLGLRQWTKLWKSHQQSLSLFTRFYILLKLGHGGCQLAYLCFECFLLIFMF